MPSTPLTDAIVALTTYANTVTGESDTTLSDAVETLVDGYGGLDINSIAEGTVPSGTLILDTATSIAENAFYGRTAITRVEAPLCEIVYKNAFAYCSGLTGFYLPKVTEINNGYQFVECTGLLVAVLPSLTGWVTIRAFHNCTHLTTADFGAPTKITSQAFIGASALRTLIIRGASVTPLEAWNANALGGIYSNPTASKIYVPSSLISSYQSASNWSSAYSAGLTFEAIEGSQYENYYADGTPVV